MKTIIYTIISPPILFFAGFFTFVIVSFILLFSTLKINKVVVGLLKFWARTIFLLIGKKLHFIGLNKIDKNKKYILVANHGSLFDIMGIMALCPNVSWLGKDYLMKIPIFKNALQAINFVPMKTSDLRNTKEMINKMISNSGAQTIAIFPEGKRTSTGEFNKFKKGFVHVFRATKLDILPITLNGFFNLKPKTKSYINFNSKLEIVVNDVLKNQDLIELSNDEIVDVVNKSLISSYIK